MTHGPLHRSVRQRRRRVLLRVLITLTLILVAVKAEEIRTSHDRSRASAAEDRSATPGGTATTVAPASTVAPTTAAAAPAPTTTVPPTTVAPTTPVTAGPDGATGILANPAVDEYLEGRSGNVTAAVFDVRTGTTSLWRPGVAEDTASIVKVDILATLLDQLQGPDTPLNAEQDSLAHSMIEASDNDSATALWDEVGSNQGITAFNAQIGMDQTTAGTDGYWGLTTTTAADQVRLLKTVALPGSILNAASQGYELDLMENIDPGENWGVSAGPTPGATVALKNGWLPLEGDGDWQVNSVGSITGDGRDYLVAVLTNGNASEGYGIDTIEGLSSLIWAKLGG